MYISHMEDEFEKQVNRAKSIGELRSKYEIKNYMDNLPIAERKKLQLELKLLELQIEHHIKENKKRLVDFGFTILGILIGGLITYFLQSDHKTEVINLVPTQEVQITYDTIHVANPKSQIPLPSPR